MTSAHEGLSFEYICSVTQKNKEGLFRDVVNVVFLPDWQRQSHIYHDSQKDIWFEISPVKNFTTNPTKPTLRFQGPEFSEIGFELDDLNIGARCFHRSQRNK
jgi:hypothetical protein